MNEVTANFGKTQSSIDDKIELRSIPKKYEHDDYVKQIRSFTAPATLRSFGPGELSEMFMHRDPRLNKSLNNPEAVMPGFRRESYASRRNLDLELKHTEDKFMENELAKKAQEALAALQLNVVDEAPQNRRISTDEDASTYAPFKASDVKLSISPNIGTGATFDAATINELADAVSYHLKDGTQSDGPEPGNPEAGMKFDNGKPDWSLLPMHLLEDTVKVLTFGAQKYDRDNWQKVENPKERYYAALMRHLVAYNAGIPHDEETGISHLAHAMCCITFLKHFEELER